MATFKHILPRVKAAAPDFAFGRPASKKAISALQKKIGFQLPSEYMEFVSLANGCCGTILNMYLELYDVEYCLDCAKNDDLAWPNEQKLVVIGSDGGGEALVYDYQKSVRKPAVGARAWIQSNSDPVISLSGSLEELFEKVLSGWAPW